MHFCFSIDQIELVPVRFCSMNEYITIIFNIGHADNAVFNLWVWCFKHLK